MDSPQDPANQDAARWYARLRAPDCTAAERAEFEDWLSRDARNAAAYAVAGRLADALSELAMADPRFKALVDQAASAGATLPDDSREAQSNPSPRLTITACPLPARGARRRLRRPFAWAASIAVGIVSAAGLLILSDEGPGTERSVGSDALPYEPGGACRAITVRDGAGVDPRRARAVGEAISDAQCSSASDNPRPRPSSQIRSTCSSQNLNVAPRCDVNPRRPVGEGRKRRVAEG